MADNPRLTVRCEYPDMSSPPSEVSFRLSPSYGLLTAREAHDWFLQMMREHEEFEVETDRGWGAAAFVLERDCAGGDGGGVGWLEISYGKGSHNEPQCPPRRVGPAGRRLCTPSGPDCYGSPDGRSSRGRKEAMLLFISGG